VFFPARAFFVDAALEHPEAVDDGSTKGEDCVYIDGFTELLLVAIKAFYARDDRTLAGTLSALARHPLAEDANNEDKLLLLTGRAARIRGDHSEAQRTYERLLYHPMFGEEAKEITKHDG